MAGLILVSLLFPLLLIEITARLIPGLIPTEIRTVFQHEQTQDLKGLIPDKELGYKYAPDLVDFVVPFGGDAGESAYTVSTVSLGYEGIGFRDNGLTREPFAVIIGDSVANCASVEMQHCWVELLEQKVGQDFANLGVVGYGPQQEERMLAHYGLPLKPKLVLWLFFANDLNDAWRFDQFGSGAATEGKFWQNPGRAWLARHSVVYMTLSFFWYNRHLFSNLAEADNTAVPRDSNLTWWLTYTDLTIPEVAEGFKLTQEAILAANQQTQAKASQFVLVIVPFREQVYAPAELQPRLDHLNQALVKFGQQHNIAVLDITKSLREKAKNEADLIYFSKDIHLNPRGNQLLAALLAQELDNYWQE